MAKLEHVARSAEETMDIGRALGRRLKAPVLVLLDGELGAGKTTFAKGLVAGLGAGREEDVTSPTFTLVHVFHNSAKVYHVDLYRVADFHDLATLGLEDAFAESAVVIVEWPEKFRMRTDWRVVRVRLEPAENDSRRIAIEE
jgi:tRNA threonylcarbamoyladenosine biosynthesis protein TsaE